LGESDIIDVLKDDVDIVARETVRELVKVLPPDTPLRAELSKWDGSFSKDSTMATFYSTFLSVFYHNFLNSTEMNK
jgi:acyl-homoserine lactone acylase PvdQ